MAGAEGYIGNAGLWNEAASRLDVIARLGHWQGGGLATELHECTAYGDTHESYLCGIQNGREITFSGWYDPADAAGQDALRDAARTKTPLDTIRLYYGRGSVDFFCCPAGVSCIVREISPVTVDADEHGLCPVSFTLQVSGGHLVRYEDL